MCFRIIIWFLPWPHSASHMHMLTSQPLSFPRHSKHEARSDWHAPSSSRAEGAHRDLRTPHWLKQSVLWHWFSLPAPAGWLFLLCWSWLSSLGYTCSAEGRPEMPDDISRPPFKTHISEKYNICRPPREVGWQCRGESSQSFGGPTSALCFAFAQ